MDIIEELHHLMESCGGEDLIRYLLKEDGVKNWETITLHPIVAYSPNHMNRAIICGIAYWNGFDFQIIHSEESFENANLEELVDSVTISHNFEYGAEALLSMNRAIIATPEVIKASKGYAKMIRFSTIINEEKLRSTEASNNLLIFFVLSVSSKNILTFLHAAHIAADDNINLMSIDSTG